MGQIFEAPNKRGAVFSGHHRMWNCVVCKNKRGAIFCIENQVWGSYFMSTGKRGAVVLEQS